MVANLIHYVYCCVCYKLVARVVWVARWLLTDPSQKGMQDLHEFNMLELWPK